MAKRWSQVELKDGLGNVLVGLHGGDGAAACRALAANAGLWLSIEESEIELVAAHDEGLARQIAEERARTGHTRAPCGHCGRHTMSDEMGSWLHGNPHTPASDAEVEHYIICRSCRHHVVTGRA